MELHEQQTVIEEHGLPAVAALTSFLVLEGEDLSKAVDDRLKWGYDEFGDKLFTSKSVEDIHVDIIEELADAIIYMAVLIWRMGRED